jgi:hypothetical protein
MGAQAGREEDGNGAARRRTGTRTGGRCFLGRAMTPVSGFFTSNLGLLRFVVYNARSVEVAGVLDSRLKFKSLPANEAEVGEA